ncbi:hypothetical protein JXB22_06900 [candidate division WOR-3 bacterium]|nr:hypothetical protein [candidate division WOR-3 bacterium]
MLLTVLILFSQFSLRYENFVNTPRSDSIFVSLTRGTTKITNYRENPVVLWFWRVNTQSQEADSLLALLDMGRNFYLSSVLRWEALDAEDNAETVRRLNLAIHFDSSGIENFVSLLALGVKKRDVNLVRTALSLPVLTDFKSQLFFITNIAILIIAALFLSTVVYVLVKTIHYLPVISHRIGPRQPIQWIDTVKTLILLIPLLVLRNLYIAFICYSILLIFVMDHREKNWLRLSLIALLILYILSLPLNNCISFLTHSNSNHQLYEIVHYDTALDLTPNPDDPYQQQFVAYGRKKQGRLEEALSLYENLYYAGNRDVAVINNLANIYYAYEENSLAESLYLKATMISDQGEPFFNMGLLKLRNIEYSESSHYMEEARQHGFSSLRKEPVDIAPSNREFYKLLFSEKVNFDGIIDFIFIIPVLIILILTFIPIRFSEPFFCTTCGRPVCKRCVKEIGDEILCSNCFTKFKSTKQAEIEEDLRISVNRSRKRTRRIIMFVVNLVLPGAGLIYSNRHFAGMFFIVPMMLIYVPLIMPSLFVQPAGYIALPLKPVFVTAGIIVGAICYLLSFALLRETNAD